MNVKPPPKPLSKSKHFDKSETYFVKLKLRKDLMSYVLDLYEFKMFFLTMVRWKSSCCLCETSI